MPPPPRRATGINTQRTQSADAVKLLDGLIAAKSTVSYGGSTTLNQVGLLAAIKTRKDVTCYRDLAGEAMAKGDMAGFAANVRQGASADIFLSSVDAIEASTGALHAVDASGSRICGWFSAGQLVIVAGTNKIVENEAEATDRLEQFQYKLESARCRAAHKVYLSPRAAVALTLTPLPAAAIEH